MLVRNTGYPTKTDFLGGPVENVYLGANIAITLNLTAARLRFASIVADGPNSPYGFKVYNDQYDEGITDGDGIETVFSYGYSGANPFQFDGTPNGEYDFVFSAANMPPNDVGLVAFSFTIEIAEDGSTGWRPLEESDGLIVWNDPDDVLEGDPVVDAPAGCFWTALVGVSEACVPAVDPPASPIGLRHDGGGGMYLLWLDEVEGPPTTVELVEFDGETFGTPLVLSVSEVGDPIEYRYVPSPARYTPCGDDSTATVRHDGQDFALEANNVACS